MSNTPVRVPFARVQTSSLETADDNFGRLERNLNGVFTVKTLAFGMNATAYVLKGNEWLVLCDCTGGAITVTFPLAARVDGMHLMVVKTDASANAVTLSGTFNGVVNPTLSVRYQSKTINAGNGAYYFVPSLIPADIPSGTFPGNYVIAGTLEVDGNFSVNTNKFTVAASTGNTLVAGTLSATGNFAVNTNKFTVAASSGNTVVAGTLGVTGAATASTLTTTTVIRSGPSSGLNVSMDRNAIDCLNNGVANALSINATGGVTNFGAGGIQITAGGTLNVVNGNITVTVGATTLQTTNVQSTLSVTSDFAVNTSKFTVTASSGNFVSLGTAAITGLITATGGVTAAATIKTTAGSIIADSGAGASVRFEALTSGGQTGGYKLTTSSGSRILDMSTLLVRLLDSTGGNVTFSVSDAGAGVFLAGVSVGSTTLLTSTVALTNGAAANAGTLTNAPAAGNPTKWIPVNDNGTTRYLPAW